MANRQEEIPETTQNFKSLREKFESGASVKEARKHDTYRKPEAIVVPQQIDDGKQTSPVQRPVSDLKQGFSYLGVANNERRLVMIGKTGVGKSATGNTILGERKFVSKTSSSSVTKKCHNDSETRFGKRVLLVDTPGLFDTKISNEQTAEEIAKCIGITAPGPHAFLIVVQIGRFTPEERKTVEEFAKRFGDEFFTYAIVLFTRKEDIERDGLTLGEYVKDTDESLKEILNKCGDRCIAFNNFADQKTKDDDVKNLLNIIEQILVDNKGSFYTNEMYVEAERVTQERIKRILEEEEAKKCKELEKLNAEIASRFQSEIEKMRAENIRTAEEADKREKELRQKQTEEIERQKIIMDENMKKLEVEKRNQTRDEYQEKGFLSHTWDGICSIGSAIASPFKALFG